MSNSSTLSSESMITAEYNITANYVAAASVGLMLYDYILTLGSEIALFWNRRLPVTASLLFFTNRFTILGLAVALSTQIPVFGNSLASCVAPVILGEIVLFTSLAVTAVVFALRVYAAANRNKVLAALAFVLAFVSVPVNIYSLADTRFSIMTQLGSSTMCIMSYQGSSTSLFRAVLIARLTTIVSDVLVISITWNKTFRIVRHHARIQELEDSIMWYFLRDGTIYFLLMLMLNILDSLLWWYEDWTYLTSALTIPISTVVVGRLLINLREAAFRGIAFGSHPGPVGRSGFLDVAPTMSDPVFQSPATEAFEEPYLIEDVRDVTEEGGDGA